MAKPDMHKIRQFHPERFGVDGVLKEAVSLEDRKVALEELIKKAKEELKEVEKQLKETPEEDESVEGEDAGKDVDPKEALEAALNEMTVDQLKKLAKDKEIDLGQLKAKGSIIDKLVEEVVEIE